MLKSVEKLSREERVERVKDILKMSGGNLVLDGNHLMRVWSLTNNYYGLEDMRLSEVRELIQEVHDYEVLEIAKWSLQFSDKVRSEKITEKVIEELDGEYDYRVDIEISNVVESLLQ